MTYFPTKINKYVFHIQIYILLLIVGCYKHDITLIEHTAPSPIVIPTTLPADKIILVLDEDLEKYKEIIYIECDSRFKRFVAVMARDKGERSVWETKTIDKLSQDLFLSYRNYDIVFFIDNPKGTPLTKGKCWYFKTQVYNSNGINVNIWDITRNEK